MERENVYKRSTMNKFVYRMLCKNYEQASRLLIVEMRRVKSQLSHVDKDILEAFQENLTMLRVFLDHHGITMPKPKWRYDDKNQDTWLFTPHKQINKSFLMLRGRRR